MQDILIFPFGGNGLEAMGCLGKDYNFLGFIDDTPEKQGIHPLGFMVYPRTILNEFKSAKVIAVPGSPASYLTREKVISGLGVDKDRFATVIHPSAIISKLAVIGKNTLIMAGVVLTSNCRIGDHVCILPNTVVHHDSVIKDYCLVGSNVTVAGNTSVGENCYIGSGSSIINGITIGDKTLVGIGSNVISTVPSDKKVVGNPAKPIN